MCNVYTLHIYKNVLIMSHYFFFNLQCFKYNNKINYAVLHEYNNQISILRMEYEKENELNIQILIEQDQICSECFATLGRKFNSNIEIYEIFYY